MLNIRVLRKFICILLLPLMHTMMIWLCMDLLLREVPQLICCVGPKVLSDSHHMFVLNLLLQKNIQNFVLREA